MIVAGRHPVIERLAEVQVRERLPERAVDRGAVVVERHDEVL
jgi:hypothetical protein